MSTPTLYRCTKCGMNQVWLGNELLVPCDCNKPEKGTPEKETAFFEEPDESEFWEENDGSYPF